ncbi:MAG: GNAT family N-acetyltransferase [Bacteroidota bacterium]
MISITEITAEETYDLRQRVMWPDRPLSYIQLKDDKTGIHYGLWENDRLLSVISLFIHGEEAQFRKFATEKSEQGKGYGTRLLSHLMEEVSRKHLTRIWCNARADKTGFYRKFGMQETPTTFQKGGIAYRIMERRMS